VRTRTFTCSRRTYPNDDTCAMHKCETARLRIAASVYDVWVWYNSYMSMDPGSLFAGILFGLAGMVGFYIGKKQAKFMVMVVGGLLMALPYLIEQAIALYVMGALLIVGMLYMLSRD